jgi:ribosomal protein L11 methyltransferase
MNHIQITIAVTDPEQQEILIALLADLGYEGFEQQNDKLLAFIPEEPFDAAALGETLRPMDLASTSALLPERNWNEEWERNFQPVQVGDFCAIRAHFHHPIDGVTHDLVITPKMSFGTGHHATTFMMIRAMQDLDFNDREVLDFGTGTGVLAILAERLGAKTVLAIDNDDWSIENAGENSKENNCLRLNLRKADTLPGDNAYDIILANINKPILIREMPHIAQHLKQGGVILMSGLLLDDFEDIENQASINNLSVSARTAKGSWICLKMEKSPGLSS